MNKKMKKILLSLAAVVVLVSGTVQAIPHLMLDAQDIQKIEKETSIQVQDTIGIKQGEVLVAESATKELHLDTDTLDIRVVDKDTAKEWTSKIEKPSNNKDKSIVNITYMSNSESIKEWDCYSNVIEQSNYTISQIDNGVRLGLNFSTSTKTPDQLVPSYISEEHLKERFYDAIDDTVAKGKIKDNQGAMYKNILKTIYKKDLAKGGFKLVGSGLPPSGLKQLNELVQAIGYTEDMVREDNELAGLDIEIPEVASFHIVVDVTLDENDLVVNVPTYECTSGNDFYQLIDIEVFGSFGYASAEAVEDGYIFVPDGAGALFEINTYDSAFPQYSRPIYNNNVYKDMYQMSKYPEELHMPVFGMTYGQDENSTHGFMGIIESGEELATINVQLGSKDVSSGGSVNNKVGTKVDLMQYSRVKLRGPYSSDDTRYMVKSDQIDVDYTIRYKLFNDTVTYYDMADAYKDHLIKTHELTAEYSNEPKMYLEMVSSLSVLGRMVGVPYDKTISMTTYAQAQEILEDLGDKNLVVNYNGAFYGGDNAGLANKADLVKANGSKKELDALLQTAEASGNELFLGTTLMTVKDQSFPFKPEVHSMYYYDAKPIQIYDYEYVTGKFSPEFESHTIMHPKYFTDIVNRFMGDTEAYGNIYIGDVPNTYYASYKEEEMLNPVEANAIIEAGLQTLDESKVLAFNNPNMNTLPYADYAVNISRESSNYGTMKVSVPFRQLVLNGLVEYTTLDANMSPETLDYYLLQALEVGSYPKFTVSYENEDILKDTPHTQYFATGYASVKPRIEELYTRYEEAFSEIGTNEIVGHSIVEDEVFKTEYANGVEVIVNYNHYPVTVQGHTIEAQDFYIK